MSGAKRERDDERAPVPLFGTWRNAYLAVTALFIIDVAVFYFFGRYFS